MKKLILITFLFPFLMKGQISGEVIYEVKLNKKKTDSILQTLKGTEYYQDNKQRLKEEEIGLHYLSFSLLFNDKKSKFSLIEKLVIDQHEDFVDLAHISTGADSEYFYDYKTKKYVTIVEDNNKVYALKSEQETEWKLTNQEKNIQGYTCRLAILEKKWKGTTHTIKAWFTKDIPFQIGPKKMGGLPGVILELEEGNNIFYATAIHLNEKNKEIKLPKYDQKMEEEEFQRMIGDRLKKEGIEVD